MASTGAKLPTSGTSVSASPWSDNAWTSPGNVTAIDSTYASVTAATFDTNDQTHRLRCTGFDFSAIPDGSTINGISVTIHNADYANGSGSIDLAQLVEGGTPLGNNKYSTPQALTTTPTDYSLGGTSDLWGATLTAAIVKSATFGIDLGCLATANNSDVFIDAVEITVEYTAPAGTTYDDDLTDSGAASETVANSAIFAEAVTDSAAATDDAALPPVVFYVIYASAGSAPSAAQVKAGQDATGSAAVAHGHEVARTTTGEQVFAAATGLTAGTSYRVAFVWSDWTTDSNVAVSDAWSTTAAAIDESASDTAAATETITAALVALDAVADAADATETVAGALAVSESVSDSAAATETVSAALVAVDAVTDAAAGTDTAAGSLVLPEAVADSAAGTDSATDVIAFADAVADAAAATDSATASAVLVNAVADSAAGSETVAGALTVSQAITDSAAATDVAAAGLVAVDAVADSAAASESVTDNLGSVTYNESAEDTADATETVANVATLGESVTDAAAATDATTDSLAGTAPVAGVRKRAGPTRPYRYAMRIGEEMFYADSVQALEAALDEFEREAEQRAKRKAQTATGTPKQVARKARRVRVVESPEPERETVKQLVSQSNKRVRDLYESEARLAMVSRYMELEIVARQMDDDAAIVALSI